MSPVNRATWIGASAIAMWATLALLTALSGDVPPFLLVALCFGVAFLIGVALWWRQGGDVRARLRLPARVWLLGIGGLFGYHFCYFIAVRNAPAAQANLINYLWPLFIVLFAALLPGETLRWYHLAGALLAFGGAGLLVTGGATLRLDPAYVPGYLAALAAAVIWGAYSVLSRRFGAIPTDAVGAFCGATAILAALCHLLFEQTVWPQGGEWLAVLGLGLGPVGAAFFTWDVGMKHGRIQLLGALSYAIPLLSTLLLVLTGLAEATPLLLVACLLIAGGALLAAGTFRRRQRVSA